MEDFILYEDLINLLYEHTDKEKAIKMASYMKNNFLFLGIPKPVRSKLEKSFIKQSNNEKTPDWNIISILWDLPEREFQYVALDYLLTLKAYLINSDIDMIESLITKKSWWDSVDTLAANLVGHLCLKYPEIIDTHIFRWSESNNIWLARTSILFQLKYKEKTNTKILEQIINKNSHNKEFFIKKAIGWVLREYSKTDKEWVEAFIKSHSLQPLSCREAGKYHKKMIENL